MGDQTDTARLDALRLECLKVVASMDGMLTPKLLVELAQGLFEFVTDASKRPQLFVVRRLYVPQVDSDSFLCVSGSYARWNWEGFAHRFRSRAEAMACVDKHASELGLTKPFAVEVIQLPDGTELF